MNIFIYISLVFFAALCLAALLGALFLLAVACWIGRGEPDVNGDPEHDAGIKRHEPPCIWPCHECHAANYEEAATLCKAAWACAADEERAAPPRQRDSLSNETTNQKLK